MAVRPKPAARAEEETGPITTKRGSGDELVEIIMERSCWVDGNLQHPTGKAITVKRRDADYLRDQKMAHLPGQEPYRPEGDTAYERALGDAKAAKGAQ